MVISQLTVVLFFIILALSLPQTKAHYANSTLNDDYFEDWQIFSELPMKNLLKLKSSIFNDMNTTEELDAKFQDKKDINSPEALPLSSDPNQEPIKRTDIWSKKGKVGKIHSLFMLSITTLSFLAFGGYLLCLIVSTIKGKSSMMINPAGMVSTGNQPVMFLAGPVKNKKPQINYGRRKREVFLESDSNEMYNVLIKIAEGYAAWDSRIF